MERESVLGPELGAVRGSLLRRGRDSLAHDPLGFDRVLERVRRWAGRCELPPLTRRVVCSKALFGVGLSYVVNLRAHIGRPPSDTATDAAALAEFGMVLRLARLELLHESDKADKHRLLPLLEAEARAVSEVLGHRNGRPGREVDALVRAWDTRAACETALELLDCQEPGHRLTRLEHFLVRSIVEISHAACEGELPQAHLTCFASLVTGSIFAHLRTDSSGERDRELADLDRLECYAPFADAIRAHLSDIDEEGRRGTYELIRVLAQRSSSVRVPSPVDPPPRPRGDAVLTPVVELLRSDLELSGSPLAEELARVYAEPKGKLMRAALTLSFARMVGSADATAFAAAIEGLHQASLVVDDLIDQTPLRHGLPTIARRHGGHVALVVGHYLMGRAASRLYPMHRRGWRILQRALFVMLDGQQRETDAGIVPSRRAYLQTIQEKTAYLFATACTIGVVAGGGSRSQERAAHATGLRLGMAFQIVDDYLDYFGTPSFGKRIGGDFEAGVVTLPILLLLGHVPAQQEAIRACLCRRSATDLDWLLGLMREQGIDRETLDNARYYAQLARTSLASLPPGEDRDRVERMATEVIERES